MILKKEFHGVLLFAPVIFFINGVLAVEAVRERVKGRGLRRLRQSPTEKYANIPILRGDMGPVVDAEDTADLFIDEHDIHPLNQAAYWLTHHGGLGYSSQRPHPCEQSSCYPATGNLLVGREKQLWTSSTCGLNGQVRYCIVSHLEDRKKCFWCDSRPQNSNNPLLSHRIENIVYKYFPGTEKRSWWQSENGLENVTIQLDLEAEFHFTHLIITFKTFRPAAMLIERSYDFGSTWQVYRYFAYNCDESFPGIPKISPRSLTDVVCESRYSNVAPSTDGEVIFRVLPPNLPINDPYSQEVQNLLKMTNLRINFTKLHTLGDDLLDYTQEIQEKYYYAINHMIVRGSCSCYGHASRCLPLPNVEPRPDMVHGRCECTHNTRGLNCEMCEDFYSDLPWKPAIGKLVNACKKCNCNNHATSCHFDAAVYEATGHVSGGVCDGCLHNTMGHNCEQCKPFFYQDPDKDITDSEVCQPCECDDRGSLDDGTCNSRTDLENGLEAGRCNCKENVDGRRCDRCKNGFWNFGVNNPYGCEPCTCNTLGTVDNRGCNTYTGECTCKRFVTGRNCNQCMNEYWGLSDNYEGCKSCDCDPGGSIDNNCDVIMGQCRCRPHVTGRTCSQPDQSYFSGALDFLVYEAELARSSENSHIVIREPFRDNSDTSWTGTGFMQMSENSDLEFTVDNVQTSMEYDIVVRYEPQLPGSWEDVQVVVDRPGPVDQDGPCANSLPQDDNKHVSLPEGSRSVAVFPPVCLEAGKTYKIHLEFKHYNDRIDTPSASVLIDSVALIPRIESIPFFHDSPTNELRRQEYERYRCGQAFYEVVKGTTSDVCKKYHYSIGFYVHGGAFSCHCDPTGSLSSLCDPLGGACQCKKNVVGRTCDRCAPGTYGFGPEGCKACDCNPTGALDNFCDVITGMCKCHRNRYGRACDKCQPGFWNYPNCQRCTCNGHADGCDSRTGSCTNCGDYTTGHYCERCIEGSYGDPSIDGAIPCRPCPCPGTIESGHSYASRCSLDAHTKDVVCECNIGYAGYRCDICADNYYGNPDVPGGSCQPCNCNNNIDISRPGNCDVHVGKCLQCLFNTEGANCEICKANYYGVAVNQSCRECVCDLLGTDKKAGPCNNKTGQCPCLPNVIGLGCDECAENHWKIASGTGCEPCNCDPIGSFNDQCNLYEGQCDCKPGFGGRQCNQCQTNYWGNPTVECYACDCNQEGAKTLQCHRENGSCICLTGIGGEKCSECARGYLGTSPNCIPCGECFDNWDRILNELQDETFHVIQAASEIKQTGVTGAYTQAFEALEKKLGEIKNLLENTTVSTQDLENIVRIVEKLRSGLNESSQTLDVVESQLQSTTQRIYLTNLALLDLQNKSENLRNKAKNLKNEATKLQEANVEGALNLTRESQKASQKAQQVVDSLGEQLQEAERNYKRTEARINRTANQFQKERDGNDNALAVVSKKLEHLEKKIPGLNEKICDKHGEPCDQLCGGAGCGSCGGLLSCEQGAVTKAATTVGLGKDAKEAIKKKEAHAEELLRGISQAKQETTAANDLAKEAYDKALLARNRSENMIQETRDVSTRLSDFLSQERAKPSDIRNLADEVKAKNINLKPEEIMQLADAINLKISSLTDIDAILVETADNLTLANSLKAKADAGKNNAEAILNTTHQVVTALNEAKDAQETADQAIQKAKGDIETAKWDLTSIGSETDEANSKANKTLAGVTSLTERLKQLQTSMLINELAANEVAEAAKKIKMKATQAQVNASKLNSDYESAAGALNNRATLMGEAHMRALNLRETASQFFVGTSAKRKELADMNVDYVNNEHELNMLAAEIESLIERMNLYLGKINTQSEYYRTCVS